MEFHEKLQELRKRKGLTQEELAEALFVSRTAVSKWESGRGYPSIDSLKEIANYFSVTIDELLSGEKLLSIAERENKSNLQSLCDLLCGIIDIFSFLLMVLPLYPNTKDGYIHSVTLFAYTQTIPGILSLHWLLYFSLIAFGIIKVLLIKVRTEKKHKIVTNLSMGLHILTVLFLALTREAYAVIVSFLFLVIKGILLLKYTKAGN